MKIIKSLAKYLALAIILLIVGFDIWGRMTLGTISPDPEARVDRTANEVVMVFGATGSVGDGLLKAAMEDEDVKEIHVVTRSSSPRIESGAASGRLIVHMHKDFEDYESIRQHLSSVNTVLWALGTSSLSVDEETYTWIHVNFPLAFVKTWLQERTEGPMSFHNVTGMGTDPEGADQWAQDKGFTELEVARMAQGTGLRSFHYRSAFIRPTSENSNFLIYLLEWLLKPGHLVIRGIDLGGAMLEISARTGELENGTMIDNADSIAYADAYKKRRASMSAAE